MNEFDHDRTARTLGASPDFDAIRGEVERLIRKFEEEEISPGQIGVELLKFGTVVSIAIDGPFPVMDGLSILLHQLADEYPAEWEALKAGSKQNHKAGNA